jgi:hypothetical protein
MRLKLTLDTDVIRDIWDDDARRTHIDALLVLRELGTIDLAVTRHIEEDIPRAPLAERIAELPTLGISQTGGILVFDFSRFDGPDVFGDEAFHDWWRDLEAARKPNEPKLPGRTDYRHLHAHYIRKRDIFVTWDKAILRLAPPLAETFGLRVMTPEEAVAEVG